jgi:hypothetical protein
MNTLSVGALTRFLPFLISYRPESIFAHTTPVTLNDRFAPRRTNANVALGTSRQLLRRGDISGVGARPESDGQTVGGFRKRQPAA